MVTKKNGMGVVRQAKRLDPKPPSVDFIASVLRNFAKADESEIERRIRKAVDEARKEENDYRQRHYVNLKKACDDFERVSGLSINEYTDGEEIGEAVRTLRTLKHRVDSIESAIKACEDIRTMLDKVQVLASLKDKVKEGLTQ
jgi:multidrug resistance efflux pump